MARSARAKKVASPHHIVCVGARWFAFLEERKKCKRPQLGIAKMGFAQKGGRVIAVTMASAKKCVGKKF